MASGIVTLLTDFGTADPFVGVMKGVILGRHASAQVVDLAHGVSAQDVAEGAFWLERSYGWFPPGTVHVAVVDPGVGTTRAAVAVSAHGHYFVGPDNGILAGVARGGEVRQIQPAVLSLAPPSRTFHGRDVFAPAAAEIARGRPFEEIGPLVELAVGRVVPEPVRSEAGLGGAVVSIDRFGNAITNLGRELLPPGELEVCVADRVIPVVGTYADVGRGEIAAIVSSFDTLEIARRDGSAVEELGLTRGSGLSVRARGS